MILRRATMMAAVLLMACAAAAQQPASTDPLDNAMIRIGPVGINPSLLLHDMGRDNNVFNDDVNPKSDFTFTLTPKTQVLFRPRIVHVDYTTSIDYVYYETYKSERSTNETSNVRLDLDFARVQPFVSVQGVNSSERYDQEVDARAHHHQTGYTTGVGFKLATRTTVSVDARLTNLSFDPGTEFRGTDLATAFDSQLTGVDASAGVDVTPFTNVTVAVAREEERFTLSPDRNANTTRIAPTVAFSPQAIVKGSVSIGYSRFTPLSSALPAWSGLTAGVTLGTSIVGRYQIDGTLARDIRYSYDLTTPYYVTTGGGATLTMLLFGPIDARFTGTRQLMAYRTEQTDTTAAGTAGSDTYTDYGVGLGYRVRDRVRIGVLGDWSRRDSQLAADRAYRNHRIMASLTWGAQ